MSEGVECGAARESLSAGWDGEPGPLDAAQVAAHLSECTDCRAWQRTAGAVARGLRVRTVDQVPDLSAAIVAQAAAQGLAAPAVRTPRRVGPDRWWGLSGWRVALAFVAVSQLGLGIAQLWGFGAAGHSGHMGMAIDDHLFNESSAWNIAIGAGFAAAAMLPRLAAGLLPMLQVFLLVLIGVSVTDLVGGEVSTGRVVSHGLVVVGVLVLWRVNASYRRSPRPGQRATAAAGSLVGLESDVDHASPGVATEGEAVRGRWLRPAGRKAA